VSAGRIAVLAALSCLVASAASACPVCYGNAGGPMADGVNNAVVFLLAIVGLVQIGFIALFWSFWRRAQGLRRRRDQFRVLQGGAR
jgi:hypothetical protein